MTARSKTAAKAYASALFSLADSVETMRRWHAQLQAVSDALLQPQVAAFYADLTVPSVKRKAMLQQALSSVDANVRNTVLLLEDKNRLALLPHVSTVFADLCDAHAGILDVEITTATALSDELRTKALKRLTELTGKSVRLAESLDPDLIGGMVIRIGDRAIDASISGRLVELRRLLTRA